MRKRISITVTYEAEYEVDMPGDVARSLEELVDENWGMVREPCIYSIQGRDDLAKTAEWIADIVSEDDATSIEYEIKDMKDCNDDEE